MSGNHAVSVPGRAHTAFVRANLESPVARIAVGGRATTYHLEDGSAFRLDRHDMDRLARFIERNGFTIRLSAELRRRIGE